jgi:hypothetical protein
MNQSMAVGGNPQVPALGSRMIRAFLERNYFYILSALLVIAGCYLLMNSTPTAGGEFLKVFKTLAILQGYEVLVLATSIVIVRKLLRLDDAFTLLLIEVALLLDPTFFTNNFFTLMQSDRATELGAWTNAGCLLLVPLKLALLQVYLRFRLSPRGFFAFCAIATLVYLGPYALVSNSEPGQTAKHALLFVYLWTIPFLLWLLPQRDRMLSWQTEATGFLSPGQLVWLPRLFILIPIPVLMLHAGETWFVHKLAFFGAFLSPLLVAAAVRLCARVRQSQLLPRLLLVDCLLATAMLFSLPVFHGDWKEVYNLPPDWLRSKLSMAIPFVAVNLVYVLFFVRTRYRPALWRVGALAFLGLCAAVVHTGVVGAAAGEVMRALQWMLRFLVAHFDIFLLLAWILLVLQWVLRPGPVIAFFAGVYSVLFAAGQLPAPLDNTGEIIQVLLLFLIGWSHVFQGEKARRAQRRMALVVAALAVARLVLEPEPLSSVIVLAEGIAFLLIGILLRDWRMGAVGGLALAALAFTQGGGSAADAVSPASLLVALGFLLFAAGVVVTFQKKRLLSALEARAPRPVLVEEPEVMEPEGE